MFDCKNCSFAAANSPKGFISYFDSVFNPEEAKRIYIIKGGPGTGKSGLMKNVAQAAEKKGYETEYFLCSSDPDSVDGILIPEKQVAILDGTSPHTVDPKFPGAVEEIIYTGSFWNNERLMSNREKIISLANEKSECYKRAYRYLSAAGKIAEDIFSFGKKVINETKLESFLDRLEKKVCLQSKAYVEKTRLVSAINHKGIISINQFEKNSDVVYLIKDSFFTAQMLLNSLYGRAKIKKASVIKSYSNLFPNSINALYFPDTKTSLVIESGLDLSEIDAEIKSLRMERFIQKEKISDSKQKNKFITRCYKEVLAEAIGAFEEAYILHARLEQYYITSMDFKKLNAMTEKIITELNL